MCRRICARVRLASSSAAIDVGLEVANGVSVSVEIGAEFGTISGPGVGFGLALVRIPAALVLVFGSKGLLVESLVASEESWIFKYDWQVSFNFCGIGVSSGLLLVLKQEVYLTRSSLHCVEIFHDKWEITVRYLKQ